MKVSASKYSWAGQPYILCSISSVGNYSTCATEEDTPAKDEYTLAHICNTPTLSPQGAISLKVCELNHLESV